MTIDEVQQVKKHTLIYRLTLLASFLFNLDAIASRRSTPKCQGFTLTVSFISARTNMLLNENTIIARRSSRSFRGRKLAPSFIRVGWIFRVLHGFVPALLVCVKEWHPLGLLWNVSIWCLCAGKRVRAGENWKNETKVETATAGLFSGSAWNYPGDINQW